MKQIAGPLRRSRHTMQPEEDALYYDAPFELESFGTKPDIDTIDYPPNHEMIASMPVPPWGLNFPIYNFERRRHHGDGGGSSSGGSSLGSNSSQIQQFFNRLAIVPSAADQQTYATLITTLINANIWNLLDALWVPGPDAATMLTNLTNGTYTAQMIGNAPFTPDVGFNCTGILNGILTTVNLSATTNFKQSSGFAGVWVVDNTDASIGVNVDLLRSADATTVNDIFVNTGPVAGIIMNTLGATVTASISGAHPINGWFTGNVSGSTATVSQNGIDLATGTQVQTTPNVSGQQWWGSPSVTVNISAVAFSAALSGTQRTNLYNALNTFIATI